MFNHSCDLAKSYLAKAGVTYTNVEAPAGTVAQVRIGDQAVVQSFRGDAMAPADFAAEKKAWDKQLGEALTAAGYPAKADSDLVNKPMVVLILFILGFYVTMVYGPIAAALVEMFPTNIRYTSMSLPYHIGNGWFGGFLPTTAFASWRRPATSIPASGTRSSWRWGRSCWASFWSRKERMSI